ncbi:hypothetical protein Thimo_0606 [Thioflavicoccus mobilis 8321]|uniref:Uncharacterized protein n=1 Tax=Thioflavicoccus mobilis 8321 TaxID=765912 RepID=L0GTY8_9GAMM|nr:hypothetical protein [Thioflavicoccus mobilis]AGA89451.1 hypothetical protein Thimo_0606 [Thioflavicoccus mobilis 8321]
MKVITDGLVLRFGLGGAPSRLPFLFSDADAFRGFLEDGYDVSVEAGGQASLAQTGIAHRLRKSVSVYRVTEVSLSGTRFWMDDALNAGISPGAAGALVYELPDTMGSSDAPADGERTATRNPSGSEGLEEIVPFGSDTATLPPKNTDVSSNPNATTGHTPR